MALPAHSTKHIPLLSHSFHGSEFQLAQRSDGVSNGTALWLGGQIVSHYLAQHHQRFSAISRPRAIELGSGIGLTALALSSLGWDVLATDVRVVLDTVLNENIANNSHLGLIETRELDWTVHPEKWAWDDPLSITSPVQNSSEDLLRPPFDLIVSADTVYDRSLVTPLLRTVHALSEGRRPWVLLCIERRDPALVDCLLQEARETWGFSTERVLTPKLAKCLEKGGVKWDRADWEGVEVWKMRLRE